MKRSLVISSLLLVGCGSSTAAPKPPPPPEPATPTELAPGWARAGVLRGDWRVDAASPPTSWLRPGGLGSAIYGVDLQASPLVIVLDDEPIEGPVAERILRMWMYAGDAPVTICDEHPSPGDALGFTCPADATLRYWRNGPALDVEIEAPSHSNVMHLMPAEDLVAAPELEEADRQFARDTAARGAAGWVSWFSDDGAQWRGDTATVGHEAIEARMTTTLAAIQLDWEPTVSRLAPDGKSGYTAGTFLLTVRDGGATERGTYVTLWNQTAAGWKVRFDVGRSDL